MIIVYYTPNPILIAKAPVLDSDSPSPAAVLGLARS